MDKPDGGVGSYISVGGLPWGLGGRRITRQGICADGAQASHTISILSFFLYPWVSFICLLRTLRWAAVMPISIFLQLQVGGVLFAELLAYLNFVAHFRAHVA